MYISIRVRVLYHTDIYNSKQEPFPPSAKAIRSAEVFRPISTNFRYLIADAALGEKVLEKS